MIFYGQQSRQTAAEERGFDPHADDIPRQPVMSADEYAELPSDHPTKARIARWTHQGSPNGCDNCGTRCESCNDRMCSTWGPEPAIRCVAHPTCTDCATVPPCRDCAEAIRTAHEGSDW